MMGRLLLALVAAALLGGAAHATPFAAQVVAYQIGAGGGAGVDRMPGVVLGPPRGGGAFRGSTDTLSLGLGGWIVLGFDEPITDGPGPDFTVFENPFLPVGLVTYPPFAEPGTVSVSADGQTWVTFPCRVDEPPYYPGCAGVFPVFANADDPAAPSPFVPCTLPIQALVDVHVDTFAAPACSGGDTFDLADVGLKAVNFVRIDASQLQPGLGGLAGFDLDAIAVLHSGGSLGTTPTTGTPSTTLPVGSGGPPCAPGLAADCRLDTALRSPACLGEQVPASLARRIRRLDRLSTAPVTRRRLRRVRTELRALRVAIENTARRRRISTSCAAELLAAASPSEAQLAADR